MSRCALAPALVLAVLFAYVPARAAGPTKEQCVEANDSAQDLRQAGKLRQARQSLAVCASATCPAVVRDDCVQRLADVDAAMPTLILEATDLAGNDLAAVSVTMDGQPFADRLDGTQRPLDPGEHRFVFDAPGLPSTEKRLVIREGDKARHERVVLGTPAQAPERVAPIAPAAPSTPASGGSVQRTIGLIVAGAGVAGVAVGSVFGLVAKATYDHALQSECGNASSTCSTQGASDGQTARSQAMVSTVGFAGGLALLGVGAVLVFTAPHGLSVGPSAGRDGAGLQVRGAW